MDTVLLIEDRLELRRVYAAFLQKQGYAVLQVGSVEQAKQAIDQQEFSLVLTDYLLPGTNGLEFLKFLKSRDPEQLVILMTAFGEVKLAVDAMKAGAFDFLEKPIDLEQLALVVTRALEHRRLRRLQSFEASRGGENTIVGSSEALLHALKMADQVAPSDTSCLLLGESGVGKELFAKRIHQRSARASASLISINCAAIPRELIESELFGHERGSFTGAVGKKVGLLEMADGGSLFLDEIGELPLDLQPKLLRVIQDGEFRRVGGTRALKAEIRLICATNRNLGRGIREGWFREDLYYRLAVFPIEIPPLRERIEDLDQLVPWLLTQLRHPTPDPEPALMAMLRRYAWPGNAREVRNLLERAVILSQGRPLLREHFPTNLFADCDQVSWTAHLDLRKTYKQNFDELGVELETRMIRLLMREEGGKRDRVAERLGISIKSLYNRIKALGLEPKELN